MKTASIHRQIVLPTTATDAYNCIMDERIHSSFTASPARIRDVEGSPFTAYDGYIEGENVVLERGKKIVQKWRADETGWPAHHYSEVVFIFTPHEEGCLLDFYHNDIPEKLFETMEQGWNEYYWEPLLYYLNR
jgi:activator of HSP90 ATPase